MHSLISVNWFDKETSPYISAPIRRKESRT